MSVSHIISVMSVTLVLCHQYHDGVTCHQCHISEKLCVMSASCVISVMSVSSVSCWCHVSSAGRDQGVEGTDPDV